MNFSEALAEKRAFSRGLGKFQSPLSKGISILWNGPHLEYRQIWTIETTRTILWNQPIVYTSILDLHCYRPSLPDRPIWWLQEFRKKSRHIGKREDPGEEVGVSICL